MRTEDPDGGFRRWGLFIRKRHIEHSPEKRYAGAIAISRQADYVALALHWRPNNIRRRPAPYPMAIREESLIFTKSHRWSRLPNRGRGGLFLAI